MSTLGPDDEQHEDADGSGAQACATVTRLIITVREPGSSPPIHTVRDGWHVRGSAAVTPIELGKLATRLEELSGRERQVLGFLPSVLSTAEIGAELSVSANTVKLYLRSMYRKLGVSRRGDAVIQARRHGLLKPKS
jgi:LuxR family transcriptional regulator, maltose regulon positive regulatory protein